MKRRIGWALAAVALVAPLAMAGTLEQIQDRRVLRVGLEPMYMPFELNSKSGKIVGFDVDVAKRMAKAMDVKLELVSTAWGDIIPALLTGKFDIIMSGMTITQDRNLKVNFASPYIVVGQTILINESLEEKVKSYEDLNDSRYKVTSKRGTTGEQAVKRLIPKATYLSFETEQEGVMEVVDGKADAFVYDSPYCAVANAQKGGDKLVFLDEPFTYEPLGWAVRKGDPDFLNWLDNFLNQIRNDGTYDEIYRKWFKSDAWLKDLQ